MWPTLLHVKPETVSVAERHLFSSESVTEGHPDKVADAISDAVLDELLRKDPHSRVACETMVTTGLATIFGEITTTAWVDLREIVRQTIRRIGYTEAGIGFDAESCGVLNAVGQQSRDIAQGVAPEHWPESLHGERPRTVGIEFAAEHRQCRRSDAAGQPF